MIQSRSLRVALMAAAAAILLGTLIFLFVKSAGIDFKNDAHALALLREMKDLDTRWDVDAQRIANQFAPSSASSPERGRLIGRSLRELEREGTRAAFSSQVRGLNAGLAEKETAFQRVRDAHLQSLNAFSRLDEAMRNLVQLAAARANARGAGRASPLVVTLAEHLRNDLLRPDIETFPSRASALERRIATLRLEATAIDPALGGAAMESEAAGRAFLEARNAEALAWRKFSFLTLGSRIELAARTYSKTIEDSLDEKDRWRVYLFYYAAALLIGVGYLAMRVASAQRQLREANEDLEKRVSERTRDLSQTLKRLKESEAQLVQTEKMSSLGQMVAGVAHEINTPLSYVKNSVATARERMPELRGAVAQAEHLLDILRTGTTDSAQLQQAFEALERSLAKLQREHALEDLDSLAHDGLHGIEQIAELVTNLRNFSRLDRSRIASFNVNEGVKATLLIAKPNLRRIEVERHLGEVASITCSPSQVNQVLLNILTNAAQAIDKPNGRINVTTRPEGSKSVAIEIEDNGRGIAPEVLPKIFDPFFTTKEVGKGTGLGLSIAYKIVSQHGGRIDVHSIPGEGTTVIVTLPMEPPPELAASVGEKKAAAA